MPLGTLYNIIIIPYFIPSATYHQITVMNYLLSVNMNPVWGIVQYYDWSLWYTLLVLTILFYLYNSYNCIYCSFYSYINIVEYYNTNTNHYM